MKVITIGRNQSNDIVIDDVKVSRTHLQIVEDDNGNFSLVDFNTTNGTVVNGQKIKGEATLHKGDTVQIGSKILPWESYFEKTTDTNTKLPKKLNYKLFWIIVIIVLLLIGGGITYKLLKDKNQQREKIELSEKEADEAEVKLKENETEYERLKKEADDLFQKALTDKQKLADAIKKQKEADEAKKKVAETKAKADEAKKKVAEAKKGTDAKNHLSEDTPKETPEKIDIAQNQIKDKEGVEIQKPKVNDAQNQTGDKDNGVGIQKIENNAQDKAIETDEADLNKFNELLKSLESKEGGKDNYFWYEKTCSDLGLKKKGKEAEKYLRDAFERGNKSERDGLLTKIRINIGAKMLDQQKKDDYYLAMSKITKPEQINDIYVKVFKYSYSRSPYETKNDIIAMKEQLYKKFVNATPDEKLAIIRIVEEVVENNKK